ncbi:MAG: sulfotransferase [Gemmataceae bacterium]|nr:sulfotransferase [Gemmataceae bacterium]
MTMSASGMVGPVLREWSGVYRTELESDPKCDSATASPADLTPICVSGYGRSGSTVTMALLGTDARVTYDRTYPFERRYLTHLAKILLVANDRRLPPDDDAVRLCDPDDDTLGRTPWTGHPSSLWPDPAAWFRWAWRLMSSRMRETALAAEWYAEKTPFWVVPLVRPLIPVNTVHLVRDPRDVFLSVRDFEKRNGHGDHSDHGQFTRARNLARQLAAFAEAARTDAGRPDAAILRYEDWIRDPETTARVLARTLDLQLQPRAPELFRYADRHQTSGGPAESLGRWRRTPISPEIESRLLEPLGDYGEMFGYDLPPAGESWLPDPAAKRSPDGEWRTCDDGVEVTLRGDDAWIELPVPHFDAGQVHELWLCVRGATGSHSSVYWAGPGQDYDDTRCLHVPFRPGPVFHVVCFPLAAHPLWAGRITHLRIDVCNGGATPGETATVRWVRPVR